MVLPNRYKNSHLNRQIYRCEFFYLCSCLSTQFLYRTDAKATFNAKENIKDNIKNSITLIINITTSLTNFVKFRWQNHICFLSFPIFIILLYYSEFVYAFDKYLLINFKFILFNFLLFLILLNESFVLLILQLIFCPLFHLL